MTLFITIHIGCKKGEKKKRWFKIEVSSLVFCSRIPGDTE